LKLKYVETIADYDYNVNLLNKAKKDEDFKEDFLIINFQYINVYLSKIPTFYHDFLLETNALEKSLFNSKKFNSIYKRLDKKLKLIVMYIKIIDEFMSMASKNINNLIDAFDNLSYKEFLEVQEIFQHNKNVSDDIVKNFKEIGDLK
jgi:hypothetical protein